MDLEYYKEMIRDMTDDQILCVFGKTRIYVSEDLLLVASNENKHIAVLDNIKGIVEKILELKESGCLLPYIGGDRRERFCFIDESKHRLFKLSWMAYAVYKGGDFKKNIEQIRKGRLIFIRESEQYDCRKSNLKLCKSRNQKLRVNRLYKKDISIIGGLIAFDERFVAIPNETAVWISNYGRVISKRKGKPRLLKLTLNKSKNPDANRYWRVHLPQTMRGKPMKNSYYIHRLVAKMFLTKPDWILSGDLLDVHHIKKIKGNEYDPMINSYRNLMFIPRKIHAAVDSLHEIAVKDNGRWRKTDFLGASNYYGISPYEFIDAIGNEKFNIPDRVQGKHQYYSKQVVSSDGKKVTIDVRIIRERDKKK